METTLPASLVSHDKLVESFLRGRKQTTIDTYRAGLVEFTNFLGLPTIGAVAKILCAVQPGQAHLLALQWQKAMYEAGLAPATINSRLTALRQFVKLAGQVGLINWKLALDNVRSKPYRDTRGCGIKGWIKLRESIDGDSAADRRDLAIVRLLFDYALRRGEVHSLNREDIDLDTGSLRIVGKGSYEPETITLPKPTVEAIQRWIEVRGDHPGPLFCNLDNGHRRNRLSKVSIYRMVKARGRRAGITGLHPHALRHAAGTHALDQTNGNIRMVRQFMRHARVDTTMIYDDRRRGLGDAVADLIAKSSQAGGR
jgi:integrase/recombinase XerC